MPAGRMWIELCIGSSSSSGVGVVFVSAVILIDSMPVGEVGYPSVSIIFKLVAEDGVEVVIGIVVIR